MGTVGWHGIHYGFAMIQVVSIGKLGDLKLLRFQMVLLILVKSSCDSSSSSFLSLTILIVLYYGVNVDCFRLSIRERASLCATRASSLSASRRFILSLIEGYFVCVNARGIEMGESPFINSNGVCVLLACLRLL